MSWGHLRAELRRIVHNTFSYEASHTAIDTDITSSVAVRWHNKLTLTGQLSGNAGYSEVISGIDRLIFDREQLAVDGIELRRGDYIRIESPGFETAIFQLDAQEPDDGPVSTTWTVARYGTD